MTDVLTIGECMGLLVPVPGNRIGYGGPAHVTVAGAETNTATALARLGHRVRVLTRVGSDPLGDLVIRSLAAEGIDAIAQRDPIAPTGLLLRESRPLMEPSAYYYRRGSAFSTADASLLVNARWDATRMGYVTAITPALSSSCMELTNQFLTSCRSAHIPIALDPNFRSKLWSIEAWQQWMFATLPFVDVLLIGADELRWLTGLDQIEDGLTTITRRGVPKIVVKKGRAGAVSLVGDVVTAVPGIELGLFLVDPIGAGDAFAAGYLSGQLDGLSESACLRRGCIVGACACLAPGDTTSLPSRAELLAIEDDATQADR